MSMCVIWHKCHVLIVKISRKQTKRKTEAAVVERIAYWIRTPQVPGSRPSWYGTFYRAFD